MNRTIRVCRACARSVAAGVCQIQGVRIENLAVRNRRGLVCQGGNDVQALFINENVARIGGRPVKSPGAETTDLEILVDRWTT